jgi:hypothetical protein
LYTHHDDDGFVLLVTEVDDLIITGTHTAKIASLRKHLEDKWKITDWDNVSSFMGIDIHYDLKAGELSMNVEAKIDDLFRSHPGLDITSLKKRDSPLPTDDSNKQYINQTSTDSKPLTDNQRYIHDHFASFAGSLIYMSITCRPDISYAVGKISRGMHSPTLAHVRMLEHCLGYIYRHKARALVYLRSGNAVETHFRNLSEQDSQLVGIAQREYRGDGRPAASNYSGDILDPVVGMSDADFANSAEEQRKSISGYCYFCFNCLVSWRSKLQPLTATSTHEAELIAMSFAADEGIWIRRLMLEMGFAIPTIYRLDPVTDEVNTEDPDSLFRISPSPLLGDNKGTIHTCQNPITNLRSRHLEVRWFKIRDYIKSGLMRVHHIATKHNIADFFTKPIVGTRFIELCTLLMGRSASKTNEWNARSSYSF